VLVLVLSPIRQPVPAKEGAGAAGYPMVSRVACSWDRHRRIPRCRCRRTTQITVGVLHSSCEQVGAASSCCWRREFFFLKKELNTYRYNVPFGRKYSRANA
jgi:hypothetical protein